ncbi:MULTISPECIES: thiamine pyrophosphate-dependent enzyme [unclassified Mesorhizobium]|uniref:thiamine pyrophosphate-dependent enzyme n=1 Tax=unclassified Mesorhizobium TaxID=325217 RepID=UPI00112A04BC|nr:MULTISPECIES: thiamine pyrophosphate-dependent enzyme [unclassified Mesorhizobium]TPL00786.1 thiamine pyrophosphate-binding protein [Mesorhizobium sp. B2-4-16]TPL76953.1 thiamine pyrophosphate-binding protein [Mesorhizobium sp. B2-4-3]
MVRNGGRILVSALLQNGCKAIFGVPGESYLPALDALWEDANAIRYVTCRHEGGASFMAAAYADATGEPGVCFVTRGPGAMNASIGLHAAYQGSTPLVLLVGQIASAHRDREAFQELDYRQIFGPMTKWVAEIDHPSRIPEYVNRAWRTAMTGRPGPVVLVFPEDVLKVESDAADLKPAMLTSVAPMASDMARIETMLARSSRPLLLLGGANWTRAGHAAIIEAAERLAIPVAVGFRRQGLFPNDHPNYIGNLGFGGTPMPNDYCREADLVIAVGSRLGDGTTLKFSLIAPVPNCALIHVHPGAEELGRLYQADLLVQADPNAFAAALAALPPQGDPRHVVACGTAHRRHETMLDLVPQPGPVDMGAVMRFLSKRLPPNAFMTTGGGNASDWPNIHFRYRRFRGGLAPVCGAMGFGVPAAVAAKIADPDAPAVYIGGDGDFLMNGQEFATAIQYGLDPVFIIVDNQSYGTIRMHQERAFPGRNSGTGLTNPDFATVAIGYGGHGETVETTGDFAPAFERALVSGKAAIIHIKVGSDHLGPNMTVSALNSRRTVRQRLSN